MQNQLLLVMQTVIRNSTLTNSQLLLLKSFSVHYLQSSYLSVLYSLTVLLLFFKFCFQALYENLLVELPLAEFFLSKLVGRHSDVDVHHLASLDPIMYRNLLFLKSYEGDVADLGLDFTVLNDELGETRVRLTYNVTLC